MEPTLKFNIDFFLLLMSDKVFIIRKNIIKKLFITSNKLTVLASFNTFCVGNTSVVNNQTIKEIVNKKLAIFFISY